MTARPPGLLLSCLLLGCVPAAAPEQPAPDDEATPTDLFAVAGRWVQPDGAPIVGIAVTVSTEFCIADTTSEDGSFRVVAVSPGPKRLITYGTTAGYRWPSVAFAFDAADDGQDFEFDGPLRLPALDGGVSVDPEAGGDVTLAGGIGLGFEPGALDLAPLAEPRLRSAVLPPEDAAFFSDLPAGTRIVLAVEPIRSIFDPPAALTVPWPLGTEGERLGLFSLNYDLGTFVQEGTLVVDGAGQAVSETGGIRSLGWHAIAPLEAR